MELRFLKPMFELGRSRFYFYSPRKHKSIADVISNADIVINMVGKYYETKVLMDSPIFPFVSYDVNYTHRVINVEIAKTIAELCTEI